MKKYKISVTRTAYKSKTYAVDADSVDEAIGQAEQLAYDDDFSCADESEYDFMVISGDRKSNDTSTSKEGIWIAT